MQKILIFKTINGEYKPVMDLFGAEIDEKEMEKGAQPSAIYYVSDEAQQAQYISMFKDAGVDAILCDTLIDPHFISFIEYKNPKKCRFVRIDADIDNALKGAGVEAAETKELIEVVKKLLGEKEISVKVERFKSGKVPAVVNVDEFVRRMSEMGGMYGMGDMDPMKNATLVLNLTNPVVAGLLNQPEEKQKVIVNQIYYLAMIAYKKLTHEELSDFVEKSAELLFNYSK